MKIGDFVHCTGYIRNTGNHYVIIKAEDKKRALGYPITNFDSRTDAAIYCEQHTQQFVEVDGYHDCERVRFVEKPFDGVFVGTTMVFRRLGCSYEEPEYAKSGYTFERYDPFEVAIVYYANNRKRLVPMNCLRLEGGTENEQA